jgi:hypothetical protein
LRWLWKRISLVYVRYRPHCISSFKIDVVPLPDIGVVPLVIGARPDVAFAPSSWWCRILLYDWYIIWFIVLVPCEALSIIASLAAILACLPIPRTCAMTIVSHTIGILGISDHFKVIGIPIS